MKKRIILQKYLNLCERQRTKPLTKTEQSQKQQLLERMKSLEYETLYPYIHFILDEPYRRTVYSIIEHTTDPAIIPALLYHLPKESETNIKRNLTILKNIMIENKISEQDLNAVLEVVTTLESQHTTAFLMGIENKYHFKLDHPKWSKQLGDGIYNLKL